MKTARVVVVDSFVPYPLALEAFRSACASAPPDLSDADRDKRDRFLALVINYVANGGHLEEAPLAAASPPPESDLSRRTRTLRLRSLTSSAELGATLRSHRAAVAACQGSSAELRERRAALEETRGKTRAKS